LEVQMIDRLDRWSREHCMSRSQAIRRLLELGLRRAPKNDRFSHVARAKASALASEVVDQLIDATASEEEQLKRKRRLIHGPREFRDVRQDQHHTDARPPAETKWP
jgi:hypothetical protein